MAWTSYVPAGILCLGAAATFAAGKPQPTPLARPLASSVPASYWGQPGKDFPIGADEIKGSGVSDVLYRGYDVGSPSGPVLLYIGYHATQQGDARMHSPSMCLPGAGWTPTSASFVRVPLGDSTVAVNRYIMQRDQYRILVYYWFQGRGRVTAGEAQLKLHAMLDALLTHRDDEALVRIVVPMDSPDPAKPVGTTGLTADSLALQLSATVIPMLRHALPSAP
jgi:EpsI family protein